MTEAKTETRPLTGAGSPASRQVSWFEVYAFAERLAANHGAALDHHLIAGTPRWCGMPDDDARKLLALVLGGVREALAHDAEQEQRAQASHDVAAGTDVDSIVRGIRRRASSAYIRRAHSRSSTENSEART